MICHMGQGPYGPGPIWAPGPWAPGPSLLGKHLTKKRTLEKRVQIMFFVYFLETKKIRDVRTIILAVVSCWDLCYVSENKGFRFAKNKLIHADSAFIAHRSRAHFCFMKFIPINVLIPCFAYRMLSIPRNFNRNMSKNQSSQKRILYSWKCSLTLWD